MLKAGGAYKSGKAHLRATLHDRSALELKKVIVNEQDLLSFFQQEEDIATKLKLRRSPLLFVDYWMMPSHTDGIPLKNPPGTSTVYYYIEGIK